MLSSKKTIAAAIAAPAIVLAGSAGESSRALAAEGGPQWTVTAVSRPTNLTPGVSDGSDAYVVTVTDTGGEASDGSPVTISDELPAGMTLDSSGASGESAFGPGLPNVKIPCVRTVCTYASAVVPGETLTLRFPVDVPAGLSGSVLMNTVRVSGGGALDASASSSSLVSATPAEFGISPGGASTALSTTQAGAHPDLTTSIAFNTVNAAGALAGDPKDTSDALPPGFSADFADTISCPAAEFRLEACPVGSQVGIVTLTLSGSALKGTDVRPVYDLAPDPGEVAKIGFSLGGQFFFEAPFRLRPSDYGATVTFPNANEGSVELDNVSLTVWGVPASPVHDSLRWFTPSGATGGFGAASDAPAVAFVSNPTTCTGEPLSAVFSVNSWEAPEQFASVSMGFGPIVGCDRLGMSPSVGVEPTTSSASSPTGLNLTMGVPQTYQNAGGLATANLRRAVVTLPDGMTVNPSAGAGLGACSESEYEEEGLLEAAGVGCPNSAKLGSVRILTPALSEEVVGSVYIAEPFGNPFGSLLALYIVARIPDRGVLVRAAGEVHADPVTGQLVTTFDTTSVAGPHGGLPPLPFTTFKFSFRQGQTSPLVTPPACGQYTTTAALTTWAMAQEASPLSPEIVPFAITSGYGGGACPSGALPFSPQVIAGTDNNVAGSYSPLYVRVVRGDGEQEVTGFSSQLPPGLTANLTGVPFCPESDIALARSKAGAQEEASPSCPAASEIGHTLVGAGVGSVLAYTPGKLYMAGPFEGAPFSVVAVTAAKVGPFDLGTVVVHLPLRIDPLTAAVSVQAGAADQIPHIIDGIVIHVRDIRVYVDRTNFAQNPTSCDRMGITATVVGSGADYTNPADQNPVSVGSPFQAADCQNLQFKPVFKASVGGHPSRLNGASLTVNLAYSKAAQGTQANIARVKVELPKRLPSRLPTLQKACSAAQFQANPAGCPAASIVGHAKAITPILPVPLEGPAYFVSHGGEAFPSLIIVLQGYGVTVDLVGSTFISKQGVTSSTFKTVPDQPVTSFQLTLPQGPYSALTALGNPCETSRTIRTRKRITVRSHGHARHLTRIVRKSVPSPLVMPTELVAQNGTTIKQNTLITPTGCTKHKHPSTARKKQRTKRRKG